MRKNVFTILLILFAVNSFAQTRQLNVNVRGVYDAEISLSPFNGVRFSVPINKYEAVKSGSEVQFLVPDSLLPGEFLLRFNYRANAEDHPYPSELQLFLNKENISVNANPLYLRSDSLRLEGDKENMVWNMFQEQNIAKRQQIGLLEQLLQAYTNRNSKLYNTAISEFEMQRKAYNQWLQEMEQQYSQLYVGHLFGFQRILPHNWMASPEKQLQMQATHWFDGINLNDTLVMRSRQMNEFMNGYMGIFGMQATTEQLRDSLFTEAGRLACEKASTKHPKVYGWMVDYFYSGYETYNITSGLEMLEQHINNPRCLTSKKQEIQRRLTGIEKMVEGVSCPNLPVQNENGTEETIRLTGGDKYQLLVFYESDCGHCKELLSELKEWYAKPENAVWFTIYSVALDEDINHWLTAFSKNNFQWNDCYAPGGINSKAANDYYVLSTPTLFLVDNDGKLLDMPGTVGDIDRFLNEN